MNARMRETAFDGDVEKSESEIVVVVVSSRDRSLVRRESNARRRVPCRAVPTGGAARNGRDATSTRQGKSVRARVGEDAIGGRIVVVEMRFSVSVFITRVFFCVCFLSSSRRARVCARVIRLCF
jgi:hypothetical protein